MMDRKPKLICTSMICISYGCQHCLQCSHAHYLGQGRDRNGKLWRWEFNPRFGPLFLRIDGEPIERQPIHETHPAWEPFMRWQKRFEKTLDRDHRRVTAHR